MVRLANLKIKIFADTSDFETIIKLTDNPLIKGFTTNPSLMRKAEVIDYEDYAKLVLTVTDKPISFEVFADDYAGMLRQARAIASWGNNIYVKIPITNTKGDFNGLTITKLVDEDIKVNITGVFTLAQVRSIYACLNASTPTIISIFAGRIADTGVDPAPIIKSIIDLFDRQLNIEVLWASCREVYNILQANDLGCSIVTITPDILTKLHLIGKDLTEYSLDTVRQFYNDALEAGFAL